ncbi:uncharacterized protein srcap [Neosynchiropus ocellatus]
MENDAQDGVLSGGAAVPEKVLVEEVATSPVDSRTQKSVCGLPTGQILSNSQSQQVQPGTGAAGTVTQTTVSVDYNPGTGKDLEPQDANTSPKSQSGSQHSAGCSSVGAGDREGCLQDVASLSTCDSTEQTGQLDPTANTNQVSGVDVVDSPESSKVFAQNQSCEAPKSPPTEILETTTEPETSPGVCSTQQAQSGSNTLTDEDKTLKTHSNVDGELEDQSVPTSNISVHPIYDSGHVVSLQAGQVDEAEASQHVHITQSPLIAGLVHSTDAQEIVVVQEGTHISGDWTNVHLKQSYLLQREDGTVCEAAIVNQLAPGDTKLYDGSVHAGLDLDTQSVEVYQFCSLVEEVAEETICGSSGVQVPQSPGYEVNLFNALLENAEEYGVKVDLESRLDPSVQILSQQISDQTQQDSNSAAVEQHLVVDPDSSHVCLVQVSESFAVDQTDLRAQILVNSEGSAKAAINEGHVPHADSLEETQAAGSSAVDASAADPASQGEGQSQSVVCVMKQEVQHSVGSEYTLASSDALSEAVAVSTVAKLQDLVPHSSVPVNQKLMPPSRGVPALEPSQSGTQRPIEADGNPSSQAALVSAVCDHQTYDATAERLFSPSLEKSPVLVQKATGEASKDHPSSTSLQPNTKLPDKKESQYMEALLPAEPAEQSDNEEDEEEDDDEDEDYEVEMDQDETLEEAASGQVSSQDEDSDEEPDKSGTSTPGSSVQVRQWISERVKSSAIRPSPSASAISSADWSTPLREKSSPLRGLHGKFISPSSHDQSTPQRPRGERHTDMAELAKHEAEIEHRTQALKREGFWSTKRLTRLPEPQRPKVQWDYLCEEMQWLSADFAQERRWKRGVARKVVRMVMRHHEELRQKEEKAKRDEHAKIRRVASSIAKEVRAFWNSVEKVVQYKQQSRLEEKRKKALDLQLDFIVGQTEKYSDLLSKSLAPSRPVEAAPGLSQTRASGPADEDDRDFEPLGEEEDDEETIEVEEQQEGNDAESRRKEIELLKEEGLLPLDQLISTLKLPQEADKDECSDGSSSSVEEDDEFTANEEDAEDEEDTIAAQEKVEGNVDHTEELGDLAREGDMTVEELLEKYKGAYASDYEVPSPSGSKETSDSEFSADEEEEETEDEESDEDSNSATSESCDETAEEDQTDEEESEDDRGDEGMEVLLKEGDQSPPLSTSRPKKEISHIAATAESLQPKGYTLATTKVKTPIPYLLHGTLREYQHIGLDWLVTMFEKKLNGILADEMGLGKTIQTIAVLAHLACEKGNWGPHLIIVPTSVMLNWEMELKRWCPGFKILTYYGSQKERKLKRQGWTKPNAFHVCITSYKLVLQDHQAFRRKSWRYLILDEAQNIKNFKSQRWQSLLNFNSHRRLLLTGTPLQNSLMELWSLMHFLMPHVFQSHREFKEWFSNPLTGMIEGSQEYNEGLVKRLHKVLRPFLLRRIKADVEKQMPKKYEHVVRCRLSKRQRFLYDDFMAQASTRETLASGHFMSVINILMQLRKVCNHPNLFDPRPIQSPFITKPIVFHTASLVLDALDTPPLKRCDLSMFHLIGMEATVSRYQADVFVPRHKVERKLIQEIMGAPEPPPRPRPVRMKVNRMLQPPPKPDTRPVLLMNKPTCSVQPASQTATPVSSEAPSTATPVVQQVVCTVASTPPPPRPPSAPQTAVRSSFPKPVLTVRPPISPCVTGVPAHPSPNPSMPQRVLLSPDMQARLPSGEVVSIAQLASLAGRPVSSCQGSKPVTFQLQGNKLTLSGAQIHQVPVAPPRPVQGNVMHLVSSGGQHHLISQPAQLTVQTTNAHPATSSTPAPSRLPLTVSSQVPASVVSSPGVVKIVVRQSTGKEGGPVPTMAVAPSPRVALQPSRPLHPNTTPVRHTATLQITPRTPGPATAHYTIAPPRVPSTTSNQPHPPRPILKVVQPPSLSADQPAPTPPGLSSASKSVPPSDSKSSQIPTTSKSHPCLKAPPHPRKVPRPPPRSLFHMSWLENVHKQQHNSKLDLIARVNVERCSASPVYGKEVLDFLTFLNGPRPSPAAIKGEGDWMRSGHSSSLYSQWSHRQDFWCQSDAVRGAIHGIEERLELLTDIVDRFTFVIPPVEAPPISLHCCHPPPSLSHQQTIFSSMLTSQVAPLARSLHRIQCNTRTQFPDLRLIQYDCGKLQTLHTLLRKLKTGGHRVLIFTQMTRMLDVLEQFLNYHGHIYLRLDGSTRVEQRQALMERFNADRRIFCFILSTRSGGVGVNLTGADTVVFYDSDWNPTMDAQAQDRCHRIGQTRDVHIYRLISERTVEENILKKANQKRMLGDMAIEGGNFTTAFFKEQTIRELFDVNDGEKREATVDLAVSNQDEEETTNKQNTTILEQALCRAEDEEDIVAASQAKAEQVAELAEFNENIPLDDGGDQEEVEELSKAEQEIAALVEQLTPIERYAMNFLEASLEDVCKEELKQAEEQVEAARKGLDQAKEEGLKVNAPSDEDEDDFASSASVEPSPPAPAHRGRKPKDKTVTSTRTSGRLRGASPEPDPQALTPKEVPERQRVGLRGRGAARDAGTSTPSRCDPPKPSHTKSSKALSPARDLTSVKTRTTQNPQTSQVPLPPTASTLAGKPAGDTEKKNDRGSREAEAQKEIRVSESSLESSVDPVAKHGDTKDQSSASLPSTSSRSPRKRQSADEEVLRGLVDDSPSAKVLRKLPGRLVTVVEEKEPRKRRRRGSGTAGGTSSEDAAAEDEINKSQSARAVKSPQEQDTTPSPPLQPVRTYPPYSPPHLSPDMPVLRNLPVRRRLETESRMAAQLAELQRGKGGSKKPDPTSASEPNSLTTPPKRKRGRPLKSLSEPTIPGFQSPQPAPPSDRESPPLSPKRKRGRQPMLSPVPDGVEVNSGKDAAKVAVQAGLPSNQAQLPDADSTNPNPNTKSAEVATDDQGSVLVSNAVSEPQVAHDVLLSAAPAPTVIGKETILPPAPTDSLKMTPEPNTVVSGAGIQLCSLTSESTDPPVGPDSPTVNSTVSTTPLSTPAPSIPTPAALPSPPAATTNENKTVPVNTLQRTSFTPSPSDAAKDPVASAPAPATTLDANITKPSGSSSPTPAGAPDPPDAKPEETSLPEVVPPTNPAPPEAPVEKGPDSTSKSSANGLTPELNSSAVTTVESPVAMATSMESTTGLKSSSPSSVKGECPAQEMMLKDHPPDHVTPSEVKVAEARGSRRKERDSKEEECLSKRRKLECSSETKDPEQSQIKEQEAPATEEPKSMIQRRSLSRQSSQESARSSSPSSSCSNTTLTRYAHHKRTYENRHPTKRRRADVTADSETKKEERDEGGDEEPASAHRSRSRSSSTDSSDCDGKKDPRLTRSTNRRLQDQEKEKSSSRPGKKPAQCSHRTASNNTSTESGSDTPSLRATRRSVGSSQDLKPQTNSTPPLAPEPEVRRKRCSALNAAAKLLAMKGRVDTPGHTPRKESVKTSGSPPAVSTDPGQKAKLKSPPPSPQINSVTVTNNKSAQHSKGSPPNQPSRTTARSTRQCPGSLVPPLDLEHRRSRSDRKGRGSHKSPRSKESEGEARSSSRAHSACSSISSDGEGGERSSRSRSSSNSSSRRTRSISSQNTEHRESRSRATSSGSDRDRSSDRRRRRDKKKQQDRQSRQSQKLEASSSAEGTPDRVLRSVAALAAVQARSPAASTRSSAGQHRQTRT